ncbi:uncharacterized protein LOC144432765 [Glandiceps talaboti]
MKNFSLLLLIVAVLVFNISMTNANTITADTLTLTVPDPASSGFTQGTATTITFTLAYTATGSVIPTALKVYFSNAADSTKSTPVSATGTSGPDGSTAVTAAGTYTDFTASVTLDATNCAAYTKLCAIIELTTDDADTSDDFKCIDFGAGAALAGTKTCNDVAATTLTVTAPPPATGVLAVGTATDITFTLAYTVTGTGGTPTAVKVYASDGASKKSTEVTATGTGAPTSSSSAVTASGSYTDLIATVTLDSTNCAAYTKLCAAITVTDDSATNNVVCINFGTAATDAGSKNCNGNDIAATTLTLTDPDPAKSGFTEDKATEATFTLAYTVTGTGGTPTAVKLYFKNDDASKKSTEVTATGTGAPTSTSTAVTADGSYTGLKATVTLDGTNCEAYTNLCAALTFTTADDNTANNEACAVFGVGADKAGKKPCGSGSSATTSSTLMALTMVIGAVLSWKI